MKYSIYCAVFYMLSCTSSHNASYIFAIVLFNCQVM